MSQTREMHEAAEAMRSELIGYCYRMTGSMFEAEDAVQETMIRVWQHGDRVREDASRRAWVYRVATNMCLDKLRQGKRRALPMDLSAPAERIAAPQERLPRAAWVWPAPDRGDDPAEIAAARESVRLSFVAVLQTLPPRQRAALILCDAFRWSAGEAAEALGLTVAAVNSGLQRARGTLRRAELRSEALRELDGEADRQLVASYAEAFERYDVDKLLTLFAEQAGLSMPPFAMWVRGAADIGAFMEATRSHCAGSRLLPLRANGGCPAFAQYVPSDRPGVLLPWSLHVLELQDGKIAHVHHFIGVEVFREFGLPAELEVDR